MNPKLAAVTLVALFWGSLAFCGEIHDAAQAGDLEKVKALLKVNPDLVFSTDVAGDTPLHWAALKNRKDIAEFLLASKAEINAKDKTGWTPLLFAADRTPLHYAAAAGYKDVVELILAAKADVNAKDNSGYTPLHLAAGMSDKLVAELLLANKADVNAEDTNHWTPLHYAVVNGNKDVADLLRQHGGHE